MLSATVFLPRKSERSCVETRKKEKTGKEIDWATKRELVGCVVATDTLCYVYVVYRSCRVEEGRWRERKRKEDGRDDSRG